MFTEDLNFDITPGAKFIESLGFSDHDFHDAINDIVDNSNDAKANKINIYFEILNSDAKVAKVDSNFAIIISDNGHGMDFIKAGEALGLGNSSKTNNNDSGRFGVGLKTASTAFGGSLTVITKQKDCKLIVGSFDVDKIVELNKWVGSLHYVNDLQHESSSKVNAIWSKYAVDLNCGTVVIINKLKVEKLPYILVNKIVEELSKSLGQVFRKKIEKGISYSVNNNVVEAINPFSNASLIKETKISLDGTNYATVKFYEKPESSENKTNEQGFYAYRCDRLIDKHTWWKIRSSIDWSNQCVVEIDFDRSMDNDFGVSNSKIRLKPSEAMITELKRFVNPLVNSTMSKRKNESKASKNLENQDILNKAKNKFNKFKTFLSPMPIINKKKEKRDKDDIETPEPIEEIRDTKRKRIAKKLQDFYSDVEFNMEDQPNGESADLFELEWEDGGKFVVICNSKHPYYEYKTFDGTMEEYYLNIFSMARPWFKFEVEKDESRDYQKAEIERKTVKTEISQNYRVLYQDKLAEISKKVSANED